MIAPFAQTLNTGNSVILVTIFDLEHQFFNGFLEELPAFSHQFSLVRCLVLSFTVGQSRSLPFICASCDWEMERSSSSLRTFAFCSESTARMANRSERANRTLCFKHRSEGSKFSGLLRFVVGIEWTRHMESHSRIWDECMPDCVGYPTHKLTIFMCPLPYLQRYSDQGYT